jgi:hypothetical protein
LFRCAFIKPAARPKSSIVKCGSHVISFFEPGLQSPHAMRIHILPRRNARHAPERPLERMRAQSRKRSQPRQRQRRFITAAIRQRSFNMTANSRHIRRMRIGRHRFLRAAPAARTKSLTLSLLRRAEKFHLRAPRLSRRARWPAINARRAHGVNKRAIRHAIPRLHRQPARIELRHSIAAAAPRDLRLRCVHVRCFPLPSCCDRKSTLNALNILLDDSTDYPILARKPHQREPKSAPAKFRHPPIWTPSSSTIPFRMFTL